MSTPPLNTSAIIHVHVTFVTIVLVLVLHLPKSYLIESVPIHCHIKNEEQKNNRLIKYRVECGHTNRRQEKTQIYYHITQLENNKVSVPKYF